MMKKIVLFAFACCLAHWPVAAITFDSSAYVSDGLVVQFDGIDNAGRGLHNSTNTYWKDLTGGGHDLTNRVVASAPSTWPWEATCFHAGAKINYLGPVTGPFNLDWSKATYNFYDAYTSAKGYLVSHYNDAGVYFRQNGTSATSYQLYVASGTSVSYGTYATGSHAVYGTGPEGEGASFWSEATGFMRNAAALVPNVGTKYLYMLAHSTNAKDWTFEAPFHAFRLYSRPLRLQELKWNALVDRVRFAGDTPDEDAVALVVETSPPGIGSPVPACGESTVATGTVTNFNISSSLTTSGYDGRRVVDGETVRHVYLGWTYRHGNVADVGTTESTNLVVRDYIAGFTWYFEKQYRVLATARTGGKVVVNGVPASSVPFWGTAASNVTFTAEADAGSRFWCWSGDMPAGADHLSATITIPADQVRNVIAVFEETEHVPATVTWKPATSGMWTDPGNWVEGVLPQAGDTVYVTNGIANAKPVVTLDCPTPRLGKLVIGNSRGNTGVRTTLTLSGWTTCLDADEINVQAWGLVNCVGCVPGVESNRVWLAGDSLTVEVNGWISADNAGWPALYGPAWRNHTSGQYATSSAYGQAYGGETGYGAGYPSKWPEPYGDAKWPYEPGSGSGDTNAKNGPGGGAVFLDFASAVTINGKVTANATTATYAYGSGGGVLVKCGTITGSGSVAATSSSPTTSTGCGGSGRIAIHYDAGAQSNTACTVAFDVRGGIGSNLGYADGAIKGSESDIGDREEGVRVHLPGSLWFTDNQFLLHSESYRSAGYPFAGTWNSDEPLTGIHWTGDRTLSTTRLYFDRDGFTFRNDGNLTLEGSGDYGRIVYGLVFSNAQVTVNGNLTLKASRMQLTGGKLKVTGNVETAYVNAKPFGGGEIALYAAPTNAPNSYGAELEVAGSLHLSDYSTLAPFCDMSNGSIVRLSAGSVTVDALGKINADVKGYRSNKGPGALKSSTRGYGGAYGGQGGISTTGSEASRQKPYGSEKHPLDPGSGNSYCNGFNARGGGVLYLDVRRNLVLNGTVTADGNRHNYGNYYWYSGSSGGSVYLRARHLTGTGNIYARGGFTKTGGEGYPAGGGGGRVAIYTVDPWTLVAFTNSNVSVAHGTAWNMTDCGGAEDGSIYLGTLLTDNLVIIVR